MKKIGALKNKSKKERVMKTRKDPVDFEAHIDDDGTIWFKADDVIKAFQTFPKELDTLKKAAVYTIEELKHRARESLT